MCAVCLAMHLSGMQPLTEGTACCPFSAHTVCGAIPSLLVNTPSQSISAIVPLNSLRIDVSLTDMPSLHRASTTPWPSRKSSYSSYQVWQQRRLRLCRSTLPPPAAVLPGSTAAKSGHAPPCSFWKKRISQDELLAAAHKVQEDDWKTQADAGIELFGLDGTLYDQVPLCS